MDKNYANLSCEVVSHEPMQSYSNWSQADRLQKNFLQVSNFLNFTCYKV